MRTRHLTIGYGEKPILSDLNLDIKEGELISFIGPNGIGKSTLIRTVCGLLPSLEGSIELGGTSLTAYSETERARKISLVLTEKIQAGNLTVTELVGMGRYPRTNWLGNFGEEDQKKIQDAIDLTRINYIADRKLQELSDGQIQKAMIARAIAQDGDTIILDEPTAHLDVNNRIEIMQLLRDLTRKSKKGVLISTHDLDLALQASDVIWLANWNQPMISGSPEDLILGDQLTRTFIGDGFDFDKKTGRFLFRIEKHRSIALEGRGLERYWTEVALGRKGYRIDQDQSERIIIDNGKWILKTPNEEMEYFSISELLKNL
jgi:iron complex transport system ATP-binding protein